MRVELINPFLEATNSVFNKVLKTKLVRGKANVKVSPMPTHDIAIFIAIMGQYQGQVVYSMNFDMVSRMVNKLLPNLSRQELENEYRDVVGEIGNMITGNAIHAFADKNEDMNLDVPVVMDIRKQRPPIQNMSTIGWNLYSCMGLIEINIAIENKKSKGK